MDAQKNTLCAYGVYSIIGEDKKTIGNMIMYKQLGTLFGIDYKRRWTQKWRAVWCNTRGSSGEVNDDSSPKELFWNQYMSECYNFEYALACVIIIWTKSQINAKSLNSVENQLCNYPLIFIFTDLGWETFPQLYLSLLFPQECI